MHLSGYSIALIVVTLATVAESTPDVEETVSAHASGATVADGAMASARLVGSGKEITVMAFNTFFVPFPRAPKISARARMISQWFRALNTTHVPDVVVLNEMWYGELIQLLCHKDFDVDNIVWGVGATTVTACANDSPFGAVTPVANDRLFPVPISSGVIILTKKGVELEWRHDWDYAYQNSAGLDKLAYKGAQLVKVTLPDNKGSYYVVGTHMQAGFDNAHVRAEQLTELVAFLEDKVPANQSAIVAGDVNVECVEIPSLIRALTRNESNEAPAGFTARGFWAHNNPPLNSTGSASNQFNDDRQSEKRLDWVIPLAINSHHRVAKSRMKMMYQYVPVRAPECYAAEIKDRKQYMSDLADHYAVVAHVYDESHGSLQWTKGALTLPNPRCSTAMPSDDEVR